MNIDLVNSLHTYLPQMCGALLVANALHFFGQNDKMEKNNLTFSACGFLLLTFQSLFNLLQAICTQYGITFPAHVSVQINSLLVASACLLMIVGGFEYARIFVWFHKIITVPIFLMLLFFMVLFVKDKTFFKDADSFYTLYKSIGLGV